MQRVLPGAESDENSERRVRDLRSLVTGASTDESVRTWRQSVLMRGDADVVSGWENKLLSAVVSITPLPCRQECIDDGPNRDQVSCRSPFV
ncbi:MAG TPA: hypothetical protein VLE46_07440, partial [Nitrospira sp.]|nr:hypothetical protein [Nitrospira sp.]